MIVLISLLLNMMLNGLLGLLVGMINSLQLIIHLPIMNVPFPANAMTIVKSLVPIVMFEILEYKDILLGFLIGDEKEIVNIQENLNIPDQVQDLKYDSHKPMKLMGSLGVMVALYFLKVMVYFMLVRPIECLRKRY